MAIKRIGCYERVSTEEQALRGFSIETQIDNLTEYCERNHMKIVDHYTDEGISGAKPPMKRPALARLLADVEAGKIDMILFTKLDRWFRSVKEYFKVQEILEKYDVEWRAIHEDYDTTSANGRMAITIFLAIAQNEREKTAERIRVVLEHKRKNKEACFGGPNKTFGYMKQADENGIKRLVKDPKEIDACTEFWNILIKYNNINKAIRRMGEYGITRDQKTWYKIVKSELYCGMYKDVDDFCEPYVTKEDWWKIQDKERTKPRKTKNNRVYLFTGMIKCPKCGRPLTSNYKKETYKGVSKEYFSYRCRINNKNKNECDYRRALSERKLEKYLLDNIDELLEHEIARAEIERTKPKPKPKYNLPALKEKLRRVNMAYMMGNVSDDAYIDASNEIKAQIAKAENEAPPPERDLEPLKEVLNTDFKTIYLTLDQEDKRRFWSKIIKEIRLDDNKIKEVVFF